MVITFSADGTFVGFPTDTPPFMLTTPKEHTTSYDYSEENGKEVLLPLAFTTFMFLLLRIVYVSKTFPDLRRKGNK